MVLHQPSLRIPDPGIVTSTVARGGRAGDRLVLGADRGDTDVGGAEHLAAMLTTLLQAELGTPTVVCTHQIRDIAPHYAVSLEYPGGGAAPAVAATEQWAAGAQLAMAAHWDRTGGRAVRFPGEETLTGTVKVCAVLGRTAIDQVDVLGGSPAEGLLLQTREHVRPTFRSGRLVLLVRPAGDGEVIPFEIAAPHLCCGGH